MDEMDEMDGMDYGRDGRPFTHHPSRHVVSALFAVAFFACLPLVAETVEPIDIADRNQVFLAGRFLDRAENVRIVVCRPTKTNEKCLVGRLGGYSLIMEPTAEVWMFRWRVLPLKCSGGVVNSPPS